ncbi:hypothetical protein FGB62_213g017 [Gracilaria domingensis]|nr:hypothetical protein FGB62_213g017 [Gracilaria domingensis]
MRRVPPRCRNGPLTMVPCRPLMKKYSKFTIVAHAVIADGTYYYYADEAAAASCCKATSLTEYNLLRCRVIRETYRAKAFPRNNNQILHFAPCRAASSTSGKQERAPLSEVVPLAQDEQPSSAVQNVPGGQGTQGPYSINGLW